MTRGIINDVIKYDVKSDDPVCCVCIVREITVVIFLVSCVHLGLLFLIESGKFCLSILFCIESQKKHVCQTRDFIVLATLSRVVVKEYSKCEYV